MTRIKISELPKIYTSYWDDSAKCVIDCWGDFSSVTSKNLEDFLIGICIPFITKKKCEIHVIDNTNAKGAFSREAVEFFRSVVAPLMEKTTIRYFVTVNSTHSAMANISMRGVTKDESKEKMFFIEASTIEEGLRSVERMRREV